MNPAPGEPWRGSGPPQGPPGSGNVDANGQPQSRPFGNFGPSGPQLPSVLPPPPPSYHQHHAQPSGSHSLSIADLTQGPSANQHQYNTQPPPSQGHPMAAIGHPMPHQSPSYMSRERELREREIREHELREREHSREVQRHDEMMQHQAREREREQMERLHREQQRPMPIHQPIPSKVQTSIHGPNGLLSTGMLANGSAAPGMHSQAPEQPRQPPFSHQPAAHPQQPGQQLFGGPSPMPGQAQLPHGQQPILNDALSYLDQVKVRFSEQPEVYNRFLDIMKDFKSQAIDTPGVIDRVSNLFNGHPALIQGFNTFLPPGYRIECGTEENPDEIRVTTPSGTMTQSLQSRTRGPFEPSGLGQSSLNRPENFENRGWVQPHGQQISPGTRPATLPGYDPSNQPAAVDRASEQDNAAVMHQQEQRGVSQLQNAVSAATNGNPRAPLAVSPGPGQPGMFSQGPALFGQGGDPKRGPVEFNHAISYVNKIKNRFAQQPEIYKQFLEILQTYQRESKPIQDVYSQVTQLFGSAPDLLEDFKQFLPESAALAKAQASARSAAADEMAVPISNIRNESAYAAGQVAQAQTPRPAAKMPPMGQFDPPSTSKENKKRRGGPGATTTQGPPIPLDGSLGASNNRAGAVQVGNVNKRQKITAQRHVQPEGPTVSPTLIPQLPEPLPPFPMLPTTQEELGFFDRAKKHIGNRASYAEFLKLMNLYSNDLVDKYTLMDRVSAFLGGNPDLMNWFNTFLGTEEQDDTMDTRLRPDPGRVNLSHCRALGPSYRHLPKRDQNRTCKGRDGMCYEVLNDVWASHPTWASEDSGFVAHRKNQYEEALHRIEEERHDYDFHIESCHRTIQLMEPIVQQISTMSDVDRANFQLAPGLGGASEAIPKRIIMKIYGRENGINVMKDLYQYPVKILPLILRRLKQKVEEWKQVQREWEKLWREQTHRQFWKSLDHQGINAKNLDKKNFQQKTLVSEIQAKYEEQKKNRGIGFSQAKHQLEYEFTASEVLLDAARLVLVGLDTDRSNYSSSDQTQIKRFFVDFIPKFFGIDKDQFSQLLIDDREQGRSNDEIDDEQLSDHPPIPRSKAKGKKTNSLHRSVIDRNNGREDSVASGSKESTPVPLDAADVDMIAESALENASIDIPPKQWIKHADPVQEVRLIKLDESYPHTTFNFYANSNLYQFFRLYEMLYSRLLAVKRNEAKVHEAVARHKGEADNGAKPAIDLHMIDRGPGAFFRDTDANANYYGQILDRCEEVISGVLDMNLLEETLRRYYNQTGWQLYTVDKLVAAIIRCMFNVMGSDTKDKSVDISNLFLKDRERLDTTRAQELQYRKQVEKYSKDGEVYRISYTPLTKACTIRLFPPHDMTFDNDALSSLDRWQYYVASYTMTDATEGVDPTRMQPPFLKRSIPVQSANVEEAYEEVYAHLQHEDHQTISISPDSYKILKHNGDWMFYRAVAPKKDYTPGKIEESRAFVEKFVFNTTWMKGQRAEDVEMRKEAWKKGVQDGMDGFEEKLARQSGMVA